MQRSNRYRSLLACIHSRNLDEFKRLIHLPDTDVNEKDSDDFRLVNYLIEDELWDFMREVLKREPYLSVPDIFSSVYTSIPKDVLFTFLAMLSKEPGSGIHTLFESNPRSPDAFSILHASRHYLESAKIIIEYGVDVNILSRNGWSTFQWAMLDKEIEFGFLLLKHGAKYPPLSSYRQLPYPFNIGLNPFNAIGEHIVDRAEQNQREYFNDRMVVLALLQPAYVRKRREWLPAHLIRHMSMFLQ